MDGKYQLCKCIYVILRWYHQWACQRRFLLPRFCFLSQARFFFSLVSNVQIYLRFSTHCPGPVVRKVTNSSPTCATEKGDGRSSVG